MTITRTIRIAAGPDFITNEQEEIDVEQAVREVRSLHPARSEDVIRAVLASGMPVTEAAHAHESHLQALVSWRMVAAAAAAEEAR